MEKISPVLNAPFIQIARQTKKNLFLYSAYSVFSFLLISIEAQLDLAGFNYFTNRYNTTFFYDTFSFYSFPTVVMKVKDIVFCSRLASVDKGQHFIYNLYISFFFRPQLPKWYRFWQTFGMKKDGNPGIVVNKLLSRQNPHYGNWIKPKYRTWGVKSWPIHDS